MEDTVFSPKLEVKDGKLLRTVANIDETEKIINIINSKKLFNKSIVETKFFSKEKKLIEHNYISYIIHSGEYTESMAYDVQKYALDFGLDFLEDGVCGWDLLPHNFTYHNGTWFLYDFDALSLNRRQLITNYRGYFKITFSNYEILKYLTRKEMTYYYLTRIKMENLLKLIPFYRSFFLFLNLSYCKILHRFGQDKHVYKYLIRLFNQYTKNYKKEYYEFSINEQDGKLFELINSELKNANSAFCVGENASKWALYSESAGSNINKFAYIDDYAICDKYYNYIYKNSFKNISTAVLYPFVDDEKIDKNISYRALYDSYAQFRFVSEAVVSLDIDNVEVLKNFTTDILIIKSEKDLTTELQKYFNFVEKQDNLYIAKNKIDIKRSIPTKKYNDANRMAESEKQTLAIGKLLKQKRITKN